VMYVMSTDLWEMHTANAHPMHTCRHTRCAFLRYRVEEMNIF